MVEQQLRLEALNMMGDKAAPEKDIGSVADSLCMTLFDATFRSCVMQPAAELEQLEELLAKWNSMAMNGLIYHWSLA